MVNIYRVSWIEVYDFFTLVDKNNQNILKVAFLRRVRTVLLVFGKRKKVEEIEGMQEKTSKILEFENLLQSCVLNVFITTRHFKIKYIVKN